MHLNVDCLILCVFWGSESSRVGHGGVDPSLVSLLMPQRNSATHNKLNLPHFCFTHHFTLCCCNVAMLHSFYYLLLFSNKIMENIEYNV